MSTLVETHLLLITAEDSDFLEFQKIARVLLMFTRYCEVSLPEQLSLQFQMMLLLLRQMNIFEMHHYSQFSFLNNSSLASKNSKFLSCRPECFARKWRCKRLGLKASWLNFFRHTSHFKTTHPLSVASVKPNLR